MGGFRGTHLEARRAQQVALIADDPAVRVIAFGEAGMPAAALLAADLDGTRRLVDRCLGPLAADTRQAAELRDTLLAFLAEQGSYVAAARRTHLHENTVKYRVDKAVAARGRPLEDGRLDLELALTACRWLGRAVLAR